MMRAASDGTRLQLWFEAQRLRAPAPTRAWYAALAFGIAELFFGIQLAQTFPATGAGFADGYGSPAVAFAFARGQADLLAVFGPESDPLQVARLAAMRAAIEGDCLFTLFYAGFLACGIYALWRELRSRLLFAAVALPIAAALCGVYANMLLLDIQSAFTLGDYSPAMASLPGPVGVKFVLLGLTNLVIAYGMTELGPRWQLPAALVMAPTITIPMALVSPPAFGWTLPAAIGAGWIGLFALAAIGSWRGFAHARPLADFEPAPPPRRSTPPRELTPIMSGSSFGRKR